MKNIFVTIIFIVGIMTTSNAQGITMTLGGNTADDKFIVENSDSEAGLVVTGEGKVGIGTTSPLAKLHINGDDGTVFIGTLNKGIIPMEGEGSRMMWYPKKAAFRAGYVLDSQWDDANIGFYSTALGCVTIASGTASTALGFHTNAEAYATVALGRFNVGGATSYGWIETDPLFEIGIGTDDSNRANAVTVLKNGNVGIGTTTPVAKLNLVGNIKIVDGTEGAGKVLMSNASGLASWQALTAGAGYFIGDFAQGGVVFWLDETGQHGLVCAKEDQSSSSWWASGFGDTQAKGDGPFAGELNTSIIIAAQAVFNDGGGLTYAARICNELQVTEGSKTYGDWYLPSKQELNLLYQNKATIDATATANGGSFFATSFYWSSTDYDQFSAWEQRFSDGVQYYNNKVNNFESIRAVRAF